MQLVPEVKGHPLGSTLTLGSVKNELNCKTSSGGVGEFLFSFRNFFLLHIEHYCNDTLIFSSFLLSIIIIFLFYFLRNLSSKLSSGFFTSAITILISKNSFLKSLNVPFICHHFIAFLMHYILSEKMLALFFKKFSSSCIISVFIKSFLLETFNYRLTPIQRLTV